MFDRFARSTLVLVAAAGAAVAGAADLHAQQEDGGQECQLEGTEVTRQAEQLIDQASKLDTVAPQQAQASYQKALTRIQLAMKQNEEDATARWLAARARLGLDEYEEADSLFDAFVEMKPACQNLVQTARTNAWVSAYNAGIRAYQGGNDSTALQQFEKANVIHPDARSINNAALLHQQRGNVERAEELYRRSLEVAQDTAQVRAASINLAELLRQQGRTEESLQLYSDYLSEHPSDVDAAINYAVGLRAAGRQDSANALFQQLLERDDLSFEQWFNAGLGLIESQSYEGARMAFERARELRPYDKLAMQNLAQVNMGMGNFQRAAALSDTLVEWYPYQKDLYRTLMQSHDRQGNTQRVQEILPQLQQMPLEIPQARMVQQGDGTWVVQGQITGGGAAGQSVTVPFEFFDQSGSTVVSRELSVQLPAQGQTRQFELQVSADQAIAGFRYGEVRASS